MLTTVKLQRKVVFRLNSKLNLSDETTQLETKPNLSGERASIELETKLVCRPNSKPKPKLSGCLICFRKQEKGRQLDECGFEIHVVESFSFIFVFYTTREMSADSDIGSTEHALSRALLKGDPEKYARVLGECDDLHHTEEPSSLRLAAQLGDEGAAHDEGAAQELDVSGGAAHEPAPSQTPADIWKRLLAVSCHHSRRVNRESQVPSELLADLKSSSSCAESCEAAFVAYSERVVCSYERACDAFILAEPTDVEAFRELVGLYRAVKEAHGIRDYAVECSFLARNKLSRRELRVRWCPAGLYYMSPSRDVHI